VSADRSRLLVAADFGCEPLNSEVAAFFERDDTDFFNLGYRQKNEAVPCLPFGEVCRRLRSGTYRLAFIANPVRLWNPRKAFLRNTLRLAQLAARGPAPFLLRPLLHELEKAGVVIGGIDRSDRPIVDNARFPILAASCLFFKRELPLNPANAFLYTSDKTEDTGNIHRIPFFAHNLLKLRPLSLGIADRRLKELQRDYGNAPKEIDVIFAGSTRNRPSRQIGLRVLERLRDEGYQVVASEEKFPRKRYYDLLSRSLICWSPEGFGFDCYRTYEAAALGAAPLLKHPPILQYQPFEEGKNGLYYRHEAADLYDRLKAALEDRERLRAMGERAREHVERRLCGSRISDDLVETLETAGSGL